jgi:hypothetical protein
MKKKKKRGQTIRNDDVTQHNRRDNYMENTYIKKRTQDNMRRQKTK